VGAELRRLAIGWEPSKQRNPAERMSNRLKDRAAIRISK
jgi:hypothetical protein